MKSEDFMHAESAKSMKSTQSVKSADSTKSAESVKSESTDSTPPPTHFGEILFMKLQVGTGQRLRGARESESKITQHAIPAYKP